MNHLSDLGAARAAVRSSLYARADSGNRRASLGDDRVEDLVLPDVEARANDTATLRRIRAGSTGEQAKADCGLDRPVELIDDPGARNGKRRCGCEQQSRAPPIGEECEAMLAGMRIVVGKSFHGTPVRGRENCRCKCLPIRLIREIGELDTPTTTG